MLHDRKRAFTSIRKRPGMYIGDPEDGSGLHNMLWVVVSNCLDEHLAGHCRRVEVTLHADGSARVSSKGGRGAGQPTAAPLACAQADARRKTILVTRRRWPR